MNLVSKIFAILVLVLSLGVAVLSWKLFDQRKVFREHSEALAQGLQRVATEVRGMDGVDISGEMGKVTYTKAPDGGKESGTLGFEDFRKNASSVSTAVNSLIEGLNKRQAQMEAFAVALQKVGTQLGVPAAAGVNKENLLAEDYEKCLAALDNRSKLVAARDEVIRKGLMGTADKIGASSDETTQTRFQECARNGNSFAIAKTFDEIDCGIELLKEQSQALAKSMAQFTSVIDAYKKEWSFTSRSIGSDGVQKALQVGADDLDAARRQFIADLKAKLEKFASDAKNLNAFITELNKANGQLRRDKSVMQETVDRLQDNLNSTTEKLVAAQKQIETLEKNYAWADKNLKELQQAKSLNEETDALANAEVLQDLKDVASDFSCDVRLVEPAYNFVILSAGNRQLCKGTRLIVLDTKDEKDVKVLARLEVKECGEHLSKAYVIDGNVEKVSVGDRVEMSVEHESMIRRDEEAREASAAAKRRAEQEEKIRAAREQIEKRRAAERQAALDNDTEF